MCLFIVILVIILCLNVHQTTWSSIKQQPSTFAPLQKNIYFFEPLVKTEALLHVQQSGILARWLQGAFTGRDQLLVTPCDITLGGIPELCKLEIFFFFNSQQLQIVQAWFVLQLCRMALIASWSRQSRLRLQTCRVTFRGTMRIFFSPLLLSSSVTAGCAFRGVDGMMRENRSTASSY